MFLVKLIYCSKVWEGVDDQDVDQILETSVENNSKDDLTGFLCFDHQYFLQCIEGSREKVNKLYARICNDKRHSDIVLLSYSDIAQRDFAKWSMGLHLSSKIKRDLNLKFSKDSYFDPYTLSGESATLFLKALSEMKDNK